MAGMLRDSTSARRRVMLPSLWLSKSWKTVPPMLPWVSSIIDEGVYPSAKAVR